MRKQLLLSAVLGIVAAISITQGGAFAATTASQTVSATLGTTRAVETYGGTISSTIDDTGALVTAFTPGFEIITNSANSQAMTLKSTCTTSDSGDVNAFFGNGTADYIVLTNNTIKPTGAAVTDAKSASPSEANNANVIVYTMTNPPDIAGQLTYTWNNGGQYWDAALTHKGDTYVTYTVPAGAARSGTYSGLDEAGSYRATITLSFV